MNRLISTLLLIFTFQVAHATSFDEMLSAAKAGDTNAQLSIGLSYYFGQYVRNKSPIEQSYPLAVQWLTSAAEQGHSYAQFHLGGMYSQGKGVEQNHTSATKWLLASAAQGNVKARTNIAIYYYEGKHIEQELNEAYAWASLASYQGSKNAANLVSQIIPKLANRSVADNLAGEYFKKYGVTDPYAK